MISAFTRLLIVSLVTVITLFISCTTDLEKINKISGSSNTMVEKGEEVEIQYSEMGHRKATVLAPLVITHGTDNPSMEFPDGVRLYFYDDRKDTTSKLTADYGIYYTNKEEMMVRDNVVIVNVKGETLNTEELVWKRKDEKIYSDKFVRITTPEEIIYGTGFEAKQDFSDYTIKNISGIVHVKD